MLLLQFFFDWSDTLHGDSGNVYGQSLLATLSNFALGAFLLAVKLWPISDEVGKSFRIVLNFAVFIA